jgi:hypothetical protein
MTCEHEMFDENKNETKEISLVRAHETLNNIIIIATVCYYYYYYNVHQPFVVRDYFVSYYLYVCNSKFISRLFVCCKYVQKNLLLFFLRLLLHQFTLLLVRLFLYFELSFFRSRSQYLNPLLHRVHLRWFCQ